MTVIKQWAPTVLDWETILVGEPGADGADGAASTVPGPPGPPGPIGAGLSIQGAYFGTSTPLPTPPGIGALYILGPPLPTLAPDRLDATAKQNGDGMAWDGTAWINTGPSVGPRGFTGPGVPSGGTTGQTLVKTSGTDYATGWTSGVATDAAGTLLGFYGATPVAKAANPGTATGTNAAVINAIVTALRNLGLVT